MRDEITLTLNNPLTDEQWDAISDVDFDRTDRIWFHTKHGKEVEFAKVIRCKDCKRFYQNDQSASQCKYSGNKDGYCFIAERKEE